MAFDATLNLPAGAWLNNYGTILKSGGTNLSSFRGQNVYTNYGLIDVRTGRLEFLHGRFHGSFSGTAFENADLVHGAELSIRRGWLQRLEQY